MSSGARVTFWECASLPAVLRAPRRAERAVREQALRGVREMLDHARAHVPHYREDPAYAGGLTDLAGLAALPILDKRAVLAAGPERFCDPRLSPRDYHVDSTSGSTGVRLRVRHDERGYGYHGATVFRRFVLSGYRPWWRIAQFKAYPRPVRWFQRLGLFPRTVIASGRPEREMADQLLRARPQLIMGYPVVLRGLLRELTAEELARLRKHLRLVMTDSELLTDEMAGHLRAGFGVPVLDEYSAYEVLTVSAQCRAGSMHIDEDRVWLEVVGEDGVPVPDGEVGSVVATHYRERAMPLVRYRVGDRARIVPGPCACGSGFRRMKLVDGRENDFVTLPGGRRVYSGVFLSLAKNTPGVAECMIRQARDGRITVHLVPDLAAGVSFEQAARSFAAELARLVGAEVPASFEPADRVRLAVSGKGRFVESAYDGSVAVTEE
jgi:phenylacetate-CoA ligase